MLTKLLFEKYKYLMYHIILAHQAYVSTKLAYLHADRIVQLK